MTQVLSISRSITIVMSRVNSGKFEEDPQSSTPVDVLDTLTEFQNVCRFCYNFEKYCKCSYDSDNDDSEEDGVNEERDRSVEIAKLSQSHITFYSAPLSSERVRKSVDVEEYCLKSRYRYTIGAKESKTLMTNLVIQRREGELARKLEVKSRIKSDWLNDTFNSLFICKAGVVSPSFRGDLVIKIFNKTCNEIVINEGSPVAMLQSKTYEYE